ncbi:MAG TPA: YgiQ family radical SAM protein, partial [Ruminococcus sp.]|nr:YgiQ family radical SAM protein [Ruminococcus sp.]
VLEALKTAGRRDLIGTSPKCLVEDIPRTGGKGGDRNWQKNSARQTLQKNRNASLKKSDRRSGNTGKKKGAGVKH